VHAVVDSVALCAMEHLTKLLRVRGMTTNVTEAELIAP
jgi:hypothetical protein